MKTLLRTKVIALFGMVLLIAGAAMAHGDKKHVIGTVEKINADSVVVKTAAGKSVEVKLLPATMYVAHAGNEDKPAKIGELAVGDRVVIHATPKGETLEANEVRFSEAGSPAGPVKPKH